MPVESARSDPPERRGGAPNGEGTSSFMVLILHLLTFVCCANWIFGPLGIVFAVRSAMNREQGRLARAELLARYSWYCLGAGLVMLVVMVVLVGALAYFGLPIIGQSVVPY